MKKLLAVIGIILLSAMWCSTSVLAQSDAGYPIDTPTPTSTPTLQPTAMPIGSDDEKSELNEDDYAETNREIGGADQQEAMSTGHDAAVDVPAGGEGPYFIISFNELISFVFGIVIIIAVCIILILDKTIWKKDK